MNKTIIFSFFLLMFSGLFAESGVNPPTDSLKKIQAADCQRAKDTLGKRLIRGEVGFFNPTKFQPGLFSYIIIDKSKYSKIPFPKTYITPDFISCFNLGVKGLLDSIYKVDFFKRADSILTSYDNSGRGYRNAEFPGGAGALQKFLDKNIIIPNTVKNDDTDKLIRVYYSFIIDEKGVTSDYKPERSNCKACEDIILTALKKLPVFAPATNAGKPKKIRYILPYIKN